MLKRSIKTGPRSATPDWLTASSKPTDRVGADLAEITERVLISDSRSGFRAASRLAAAIRSASGRPSSATSSVSLARKVPRTVSTLEANPQRWASRATASCELESSLGMRATKRSCTSAVRVGALPSGQPAANPVSTAATVAPLPVSTAVSKAGSWLSFPLRAKCSATIRTASPAASGASWAAKAALRKPRSCLAPAVVAASGIQRSSAFSGFCRAAKMAAPAFSEG